MADPTTATGLIGRWKATSISGVDGDPISSWPALTGTAFSQATSGRRPVLKTGILGGKPVARFDGVDDCLDSVASYISGGTTVTVYMVCVLRSTSTSFSARYLVGLNGSSAHDYDAADQFLAYRGASVAGLTTEWALYRNLDEKSAATVTQDVAFAGAVLLNGSTGSVYTNGTVGSTPTASTGALSIQWLVLGAGRVSSAPSEFNQIDVAEVLVYSAGHDATNRAIVHTYVQDEYGITVSDYSATVVTAAAAASSASSATAAAVVTVPAAAAASSASAATAAAVVTVPAATAAVAASSATATASVTALASASASAQSAATASADVETSGPTVVTAAATASATSAATASATVVAAFTGGARSSYRPSMPYRSHITYGGFFDAPEPEAAVYLFRTPTRDVVPPIAPDTRGTARGLFRHYPPKPQGVCLIVNGTAVTEEMVPTGRQLREADAHYLGGHDYWLTASEAQVLLDAGYEMVGDDQDEGDAFSYRAHLQYRAPVSFSGAAR